MPPKPNPRTPPASPSRVRRITLGGWDPLGTERPLEVDLDGNQIAFFGKNGVGKSALFEGLFRGLRAPWLPRGTLEHEGPKTFEVEIEAPDFEGGVLHYRYEWHELAPLSKAQSPAWNVRPARAWSETCWSNNPDKPLWRVQESEATWAGGEGSLTLPPGAGLLQVPPSGPPRDDLSALRPILHLCEDSRQVRAGIPGEGRDRQEIYLRVEKEASEQIFVPMSAGVAPPRLGRILMAILGWHLEEDPRFTEFEALGRRLDLFERLTIETYVPETGDGAKLVAIVAGGVNAGLLSDGTLRMTEILIQLLLTPPGALLLIEEPETGVHPGLLAGLLNELDAYSQDRQILFSTHSPLVVSHMKPSDLRLVGREKGGTTVRKLSSAEASRAGAFLEDQGTLGDFVFDGGI